MRIWTGTLFLLMTVVGTMGFVSSIRAADSDPAKRPAGARDRVVKTRDAKRLSEPAVVESTNRKPAVSAARNRMFLPEPGEVDTIRVQSLGGVKPGTSFGIDVRISNDEALSAISLPLVLSPQTLAFDSASFAAGLARHVDVNITNSDQYEKTGRLLLASLRMMGTLMQPGGDTLYCRLFFTVPADATPHVVTIRTGTYPPSNSLLLTSPEDELGHGIVPEFIVGRIGVGMALPKE